MTAATSTPSDTDADLTPPDGSGRRNWWRVLGVAVVALLVLEGVAQVIGTRLPDPLHWPRYEVQRKADRLDALGTDGCLDLAVFGSSVANAAIDPSIVVEASPDVATAYNASLGGAGIDVMDEWARDVVLPAACPSTVVIAVSPRDLNDANPRPDDFTERYLGSIGREERLGTLSAWERFRLNADDWFGLVRLRRSLREPSAAAAWVRNRGGPWRIINDPDGQLTRFRNLTYVDSEARRDLDRATAFKDYRVGGKRADGLADFVAAASETADRVIVVKLPFVLEGHLDLLPGGQADLDAFDAVLAQTAQASGAEFVDLATLFDQPDDFADDYHPNGSGSARISAALAEALSDES